MIKVFSIKHTMYVFIENKAVRHKDFFSSNFHSLSIHHIIIRSYHANLIEIHMLIHYVQTWTYQLLLTLAQESLSKVLWNGIKHMPFSTPKYLPLFIMSSCSFSTRNKITQKQLFNISCLHVVEVVRHF